MYTRQFRLSSYSKQRAGCVRERASRFKYELSFRCFAKKKDNKKPPPSNHDTPPARLRDALARPPPRPGPPRPRRRRARSAARRTASPSPSTTRASFASPSASRPPREAAGARRRVRAWCARSSPASVRRLIPECKACDAAAAAADAAIDDPDAAAARAPAEPRSETRNPSRSSSAGSRTTSSCPTSSPAEAPPPAGACPEWCHWLPEHKKWIPKCRGCLHA